MTPEKIHLLDFFAAACLEGIYSSDPDSFFFAGESRQQIAEHCYAQALAMLDARIKHIE